MYYRILHLLDSTYLGIVEWIFVDVCFIYGSFIPHFYNKHAGIDSHYNEGMYELLNYLLFGFFDNRKEELERYEKNICYLWETVISNLLEM